MKINTKRLFLFNALLIFCVGLMFNHNSLFASRNNIKTNSTPREDIEKYFDLYFSENWTTSKNNSCTSIRSNISSLHDLLLDKIPELRSNEVSFDLCLKTNREEYFYFDYSECAEVEKKKLPLHIVNILDSTPACMKPDYWKTTKKIKFKNKYGKIYKGPYGTIYVAIWWNY